uniref:Uncharacterized protein n=1 Tax=Meloidogyne enterolobii TaxID=390850 RepID=A0A6V7TKD1_MELEN|nr:unnamed protein product [Meloidogyne enterolobii]
MLRLERNCGGKYWKKSWGYGGDVKKKVEVKEKEEEQRCEMGSRFFAFISSLFSMAATSHPKTPTDNVESNCVHGGTID